MLKRKSVYAILLLHSQQVPLQQEAARKLNFRASKTMSVAQQLYEGVDLGKEGTVGLITYMRTDSTRIAASAQEEAKELIIQKYGEAFVPETPRQYSKKRPTPRMRMKRFVQPLRYAIRKQLSRL